MHLCEVLMLVIEPSLEACVSNHCSILYETCTILISAPVKWGHSVSQDSGVTENEGAALGISHGGKAAFALSLGAGR